MSAENKAAIEIAGALRAVLDDYPDAGLRAKVKATVIVLTGLLDAWPAERRRAEFERVIATLAYAAETSP